ncbi:hypothetical protein DH2020_023857 [Rehmannia glutinosa]|uniref:Pentatricopeptide repeat-containing protein n=1 Tax=Rehmannia glutinosa TaxID=99300 RepID=A0ABR0WBQ0_REHGL
MPISFCDLLVMEWLEMHYSVAIASYAPAHLHLLQNSWKPASKTSHHRTCIPSMLALSNPSLVMKSSSTTGSLMSMGNVGILATPANSERVFISMPAPDQCSWNLMVSGFAQLEIFDRSLEYFVKMHEEDFMLNEYSYGSALSACAGLRDLVMGSQIHASLAKSRFVSDVYMGSALIDMYAKCGDVDCAQKAFDGMTDEMTLASVVSACASLCVVKEGRAIHARVVKFDKLCNDLVISNALVDMYAKCNMIKEARTMFSKMMERNVVSWNALIAGYTQNGDNEEALGLFLLLKKESIWPTHYTLGNLLNACANLADLKLGRQAHTHVLKQGFRFQHGPEPDVFVGNSLIDMYMKCGSVEDGNRVFRNMVERDGVSYNAMIVGYAQNGQATEALQLFKEMLKSGEKPDHVTMIGVLCACSHAGLVEEGRHKNLIISMPMPPDSVVWGSLLAACKVHRDIDMGNFVAEKLLEIDPENSGPYVLLSNMYAELGRWRDLSGYAPNIADFDADEEQNKLEFSLFKELKVPLSASVGS